MTRRPSSKRKFSVFEFGEDDERVEEESEMLLGRFATPRSSPADHPRRTNRNFHTESSPSPVTKYSFLECFAKWPMDRERAISCETIVVGDEPEEVDSGGRHCEDVDVTPVCIERDDCASRSNGPTPSNVIVLSSSSRSKNDPASIDLDLGDTNGITSSPYSVSTFAVSEGSCQKQASQSLSVGHEIDPKNNKVVIFPDFIFYQGVYCTESCLTFSSSCIQVQGSCINGTKGTFDAKWDIDDIIRVECEWCARVDTALVFFHLRSEVSEGPGSANETSGIDKLKFSVHDPLWSKRVEAIKSLDIRYMNVWIETVGNDKDTGEHDLLSSNKVTVLKPYLAFDDETFEDLLYPEGDPDAVTIGHKDVELLKPERFINDTIIDFYIKYLENEIPPPQQHRFHFFNSFFFRKLVDLDKDQSPACESRAAFLRVHKWTKKISLFEKDYIFIPVNYSLHWSLIVICHLGDVVGFQEDGTETPSRVPCILHMDSMRGSHRGLKNLIQSYLYEEWKERHNAMDNDISRKFLNLSFISLELPQQENYFDCGLFLLHYVERFLDEAPTDFSAPVLTKLSNFLTRDWFQPEEASLKRAHILRLIHRMSKIQSNSRKATTNPKTLLGLAFLPSPLIASRYSEQEVSGPRSTKLLEARTSMKSIFDHGNRGAYNCIRHLSPIEETEAHEEPILGKADESSEKSMHMRLRNYDSTGPPKRPEVELDDDDQQSDCRGLLGPKEINDRVSSSTASEDLALCVVEDSEEADSLHDLTGGNYSSSSSPGNANNIPIYIGRHSSAPNIGNQSNLPDRVKDCTGG